MSSCLDAETRVAAGLKAAMHNPNVSEEAKERAAERLENMGAYDETQDPQFEGHDPTRVLAGYKATLQSKYLSSLHLSLSNGVDFEQMTAPLTLPSNMLRRFSTAMMLCSNKTTETKILTARNFTALACSRDTRLLCPVSSCVMFR